jgi:hypothetical protein
MAKTWTRWHSDDWILKVVHDAGQWGYTVAHPSSDAEVKPAASLIDAQHKAEEVVRNSGHRCTARCSFWIPDVPA